MQCAIHYPSPLGSLLLAADDTGMIGAWFAGQKYYARGLVGDYLQRSSPILQQASAWLDLYFAGCAPDLSVPLHLIGTDFQRSVWQSLLQIPYGQTTTYKAIAQQIAAARGLPAMSAQAVGSAVGHNPISIFVPCHRVIGSDGRLTGYAGGLARKTALLQLESGL